MQILAKMVYYLVLCMLVLVPRSMQEAVIIQEGNLEHFKSTKDVMLLNFYADWCRYSAALKPIFDKAAEQIHSETDKAILGKVDCDAQKAICQNQYRINKYPTLKILRHGEVMRKEYRGKRSVEALVEFIRSELREPVQKVNSFTEVFDKIKDKGAIGQFQSNSSVEYNIFIDVATNLKDDCQFYILIKEEEQQNSVTFRETGSPDLQYEGDKMSRDELKQWLSEKCVPLVREITFENGEELTEEGLPFMILFYHPDNQETKATFKQKVQEELTHEKGNINFVTADGVRFAHPLSHLGKSKKDLPLIAIDSFKHMYVFPNYEDINVPGKLRAFADDLHSGKLHRDFHSPAEMHVHGHKHVETREVKPNQGAGSPHPPADGSRPKATSPPESTFKKLQPGDSRYTILNHDEL